MSQEKSILEKRNRMETHQSNIKLYKANVLESLKPACRLNMLNNSNVYLEKQLKATFHHHSTTMIKKAFLGERGK